MLVIRPDQMQAFERAALNRFQQEMIDHSRNFSPRLCQIIGDAQLRLAVHSAIERAMSYGFTNRGSIRLFIEMAFLFGSAFDTDCQYRRVGEILRDSSHQMLRADRIHKDQLKYFEHVAGPDASYVDLALRRLRAFAQGTLGFSSDILETSMLQAMHTIYPEKAAYVGNEDLVALIEGGRNEAKKCGLSTVRGTTLVVTLMFAFGHGCINDPLYPWIQRTLTKDGPATPIERSQRLEKKALIWLDKVIARSDGRTQA